MKKTIHGVRARRDRQQREAQIAREEHARVENDLEQAKARLSSRKEELAAVSNRLTRGEAQIANRVEPDETKTRVRACASTGATVSGLFIGLAVSPIHGGAAAVSAGLLLATLGSLVRGLCVRYARKGKSPVSVLWPRMFAFTVAFVVGSFALVPVGLFGIGVWSPFAFFAAAVSAAVVLGCGQLILVSGPWNAHREDVALELDRHRRAELIELSEADRREIDRLSRLLHLGETSSQASSTIREPKARKLEIPPPEESSKLPVWTHSATPKNGGHQP